MSTDLQVMNAEAAVPYALSPEAIKAQVELIHEVMREAMIKDVHYGVIPGTKKPTLLKPGAQKLMLTFRFDPQFETTERFVGDHYYVKSKCILYHQITKLRLGSGEAFCSTKESKYAYRHGQRFCPNCGVDAIIKGREEYGGGWLCFKKKGGCGWKWPDGAKEIEGQSVERVANEDLADVYNTVLKMANKRSLIDAVLNVTGASDVFSQDYGDDEKEQNDDLAPPPPLPKGAEMLAKLDAKGSVLEPTTAEVLGEIRQQGQDAAPLSMPTPDNPPSVFGFTDKLDIAESPKEIADVMNEALRYNWNADPRKRLQDHKDQAIKRLKGGKK